MIKKLEDIGFYTHEDRICKGNCLDVCGDYNNKVAQSFRNL